MNRQIAFDLSISEVTIKFHRSNAMRKMQAISVGELIRAWKHYQPTFARCFHLSIGDRLAGAHFSQIYRRRPSVPPNRRPSACSKLHSSRLLTTTKPCARQWPSSCMF
ncbi:hypothetical protein FKV68_26685 (plasmid) [Sinorhizobium mexicanum]|uniref:HTH luxR-type domain-containing protein n=1 Tax=Sinorhizobium mexicanum TaxID=375549 RepID=A0A859QWZ6_9HYPH|nr:hypothetical protein FKV68_26685 [Sinorhizobium mexicanum]